MLNELIITSDKSEEEKLYQVVGEVRFIFKRYLQIRHFWNQEKCLFNNDLRNNNI